MFFVLAIDLQIYIEVGKIVTSLYTGVRYPKSRSSYIRAKITDISIDSNPDGESS